MLPVCDLVNPASPASSPSGGVPRRSDFLLFQVARLCSISAAQMVSVALGWQVYGLTGNPLHLGAIGLSQFLPGIALTLVAGHAADRFDRRWIILLCQVGMMGCSGLLAWLDDAGRPPLWALYGLAAGLGAVRAFVGPAGQSLMPHLVPSERFGRAVGWHLIAFQMGSVLGPAAGGWVYAWAGHAGAVYRTAGGLYAAASLGVLAMAIRPGARRGLGLSRDSLLAGVRYVRRDRTILGAMSLDLFAVFLGGSVALLPAIARDVLAIGPVGLGLMRAAPAVGAGLAALTLTRRPIERKAGPALFAGVAVFGLSTIVFGLSRSFPLSVAALVVLGAADMISVAVRQTLIQVSTPDGVRGRVSAVALVFIGASNELGEFESGLTAAWFGVVPAVVVGGAGTCLVVAVWAWLFPELRRIDRIEPAAAAPG